MTEVPLWRRFEWTLQGSGEYGNPVAEVSVQAEFHGPGGQLFRRAGFWDGGSTWKIRFCPSAEGKWSARTTCHPEDPGLDAQTCSFVCTAQPSGNPLYQHGTVHVRTGERILRHADGVPFFWLGDTVWNGVLKAQSEDWREFLSDRAGKGFNVIQFVCTQWLAAAGNADARLAYYGASPIHIDPEFFRWMDERIDLLNDLGFVGAAVMAWAATWNRPGLGLSPGTALSDDDIVLLCRYLLARYGAHHMAWILAGDGHYLEGEAERWRRIGAEVFEGESTLATIHPGGHLWLEDEFRGQPWFSFHGYQSGHWRGADAMAWIRNGPALQAWSREPALPQINLEFCYEGHEDFETHQKFDALDIRQHAFAGLLATVPAGITYGCHGVWSWETTPRSPMSHPKTGLAQPWRDAMRFEGSTSMKHLRGILESVEWWRLRPAPELLPDGSPASAAMADDRRLALIYSPNPTAPELQLDLLSPHLQRREIDPATGGAPGPSTQDLVLLFTPRE